MNGKRLISLILALALLCTMLPVAGAETRKKCPICGTMNKEDAIFCKHGDW